jgi:hypothetical protein
MLGVDSRLLSRIAVGLLILSAHLRVAQAASASDAPVVRVLHAIVLAREAVNTAQIGRTRVVDLAQLDGNTWRIRLVGNRTFTPCPTPGPRSHYPCDPAPLWSGADVTIDARTGRALSTSPVQFAGLAPVHVVSAEAALQTAIKRERHLRAAVRRHGYVSAIRYGFLTSFSLAVSCPVTACDPNGLYWDVTFSGMRIKSAGQGLESHFEVVINATTGSMVLTVTTR